MGFARRKQRTLTREQREEAEYLRVNPLAFVSSLPIVDDKGREYRLEDPFIEQRVVMSDFLAGYREELAVKSRQSGLTTIGCAWNYAYTYWCPDPVQTLVVGPDFPTTETIFSKIRYFNASMPLHLKRPMSKDTGNELQFDREAGDTGAGIRCVTAGQRSKGRSGSYQRSHLDEVAYWEDDEATYAALEPMVHDGPHYQEYVVSTGNGPGNLFHRLYQEKTERMLRGDPGVMVRFFPWTLQAKHARTPPPGWEPEQDEWELAERYDLTLEQVYWRSLKIRKMGLDHFRREYPLTEAEPFLVFEGSFFDTAYLNEVFAGLSRPEPGTVLRWFHRPEKGRLYGIGVDPSWGTGGDWMVAQVVTPDGYQCATLSSKTLSDTEFAAQTAALSATYNGARVLVEGNKGGGGSVIRKHLQNMGVPLWFSPTGKDWITSQGTKREALAFLRALIAYRAVDLQDWVTVKELMSVRENPRNGRIEGFHEHDDHAVALALAFWNVRDYPSPIVIPPSPRPARYGKPLIHPF